MALNFNQSPYYDDFNQNKNFHKILFKPGVSVQARELTQTQSILQDQISKFGNHIFKNHTIVSGGRITLNQQVQFLKLESVDQNNEDIIAANFNNLIIKNVNGSAIAKVVNSQEKVLDDALNVVKPPILIVSYLSGNKFNTGEVIYSDAGVPKAQIISESSSFLPSTGTCSIASIDEGVFYVDGYFVSVSKQTTTISETSDIPSARIGLSVEESIVNSGTDFSLLDPALGESNFQGPGADRYKIFLRLVVKPLTLDEDPEFIELTRMENGVIQKSVINTEYSELDNYFARRTFDTNGDFIVNRFKVYTESLGNTATSFFKVKVGPGKAFVHGYYVENTGELSFVSNKARANTQFPEKLITMNYGNYLNIDNVNGEFDFNNYQTVDIHCTKFANTTNNSIYNSTIAATAKIRNLDFVIAGNAANSKTYVYQAYLVDIQNSKVNNIANSAVSVTANTITLPSNYSTVNNAYAGVYLRINNGINSGDILQISSYNGVTKVATLSRDFIRTPVETNLSYSLLFDTKDFESIYRSYSYSNTSADIHTTSKLDQLDSGDVYFSNVGDEELVYDLGNSFVVENSIQNTEYYSWMKFPTQSIASSISVPNSLVASFDAADGTLSASNAREKFICVITDKGSSSYDVGDIIPFSVNTSITISGSSSIAQISSTELTGVYATIYAKVYVKDGNEINYSKRIKNLVTSNVSIVGTFDGSSLVSGKSNTFVDLTNAQVYIKSVEFDASNTSQSLYLSDVKNIVKIIDTLSPASSPTEAMFSNPAYDITSNFVFDNGQNDFYYDHAKIKLLPGSPVPKGNVLVLCNYYQHEGNGYFDLDSYYINNKSEKEPYLNIPSYISKRGKPYNLRDSIDFRKTRVNKTAEFSIDYYSSKPTGIPIDGTNFKTDFSAYLGRKDIIVISKDKKFSLIEGVPANIPKQPSKPDGSMVIANITHDPYTLRLPGEVVDPRYSSVKIENVAHKRWRMEDISELEDRVSRVEYYTLLNSLEQSAQSLQISDEFGLNRFKNGIITDDFSSFSVSDTSDRDLKCSVLGPQKKLFAIQNVENFDLTLRDNLYALGRLDSNTKSSLSYNIDYEGSTGYITLPYSTTSAAKQPFATRTVNLNPFGVVSKDGTVKINPSMDQWISSTREPDRLINVNIPLTEKLVSTSDWQTVSSTEVKRVSNPEQVTKKGVTYTSGEVSNFDQFTTQQLKDFVNVWGINTVLDAETQRTALISYLRENYSNLGIIYTKEQSDTVTIRTNLERKSEYQNVPVDFNDENYTAENGYITNVSLNPYIRAQQIEFVADRLLLNSRMQFFFDGENVNNRIREANEMLISCSITTNFKYGDVLAYYESGTFIKFGKILSAKTISSNASNDTKSVSLKIIGDIETLKYTGGTSNPQNADIFSISVDTNGNFVSILGHATITNVNVKSGKILNKINETTLTIRKVYEDQANTCNNRIISIMTDDATYKYIVTGAVSSTNNTITLYCNNDIIVANNITGSTYSIRDFDDSISTDDSGNVSGVFYLQKDRYKTGEKVFRIDNRSFVNVGTETTFAETKFFASSLSQTSQFLNFAADISGAGGRFVRSEQSYKDNTITMPGQSSTYQTPAGVAPPPPTQNVNGFAIKWRDAYYDNDGLLDTLIICEKFGIKNTFLDSLVAAIKDKTPSSLEAFGGSNSLPINVDSLDYTNPDTLVQIITLSEQYGVQNSTINKIVAEIKNRVDPYWQSLANDQIKGRLTPQYLRYIILSSLGVTGTGGSPNPAIQSVTKFKVTNTSVLATIAFYQLKDGQLFYKDIEFAFNLRDNIDSSWPAAIKAASGGSSTVAGFNTNIKQRITAQYLRYMIDTSRGNTGVGGTPDPHSINNSITITKVSGSSLTLSISVTFAYYEKGTNTPTTYTIPTFTANFQKDTNTYQITDTFNAALYFYVNPSSTIPQELISLGKTERIDNINDIVNVLYVNPNIMLITMSINAADGKKYWRATGRTKPAEIIKINYGTKPAISVDPVSQTFIFYANEFPNGCFVKSIRVFFKTKPLTSNLPVTCYLLGTSNGYPDGEYLPHGVSTVSVGDIKTSDTPNIGDPDTYTEFEFSVPVYVKPETLYAFMLKSDSTEYTIYTANLGEFAIPSTAKNNQYDPDPTTLVKVSATPYVGELFLSQNSLTWAADQNQDMMFDIRRCEFDTSKRPTIEFVVPEKLPQRKIVDNIFGYLNNANTISQSAIGYATDSDYRLSAVNLTTTDLTFLSAPIQYSYKASVYNNGSPYLESSEKVVNPGKYGTATLENISFDDGYGERVLVANSSTSFSMYARMSSIDSAISPMISETGVTLYGIQYSINNLGISNNNIKIVTEGSGFSNGQTIIVGRTSNTMSNVAISDAVVTAVTGAGGKLVGVNVISPGSHYASNPTLQITGGSSNASLVFVGETSSRGGNASYRYITKPVVLSPGFDAGDLRIYYTAYRPINTNFYVYYKILNRNDTQPFSDSDWQLMTTISGSSTYSSFQDQLFEYIAAPYIEPDATTASNKVAYTSKIDGQAYNEFYQFAIKIVATSDDTTKVPYLKDIRGIALPSGE